MAEMGESPGGETRRWTDDECIKAYRGVLGPGVHDAHTTVGRALLDARDRAEKAEALVAVLRAECRAWRAFDFENWPDEVDPDGKALAELNEAREATDRSGALLDALLGKEGLE